MHDVHPVTSPWAAAACRECGAALTPLQKMQGRVCAAIDCRRRSVNALRTASRDAALRQRLDGARLPDVREPLALPVVWLESHPKALKRHTLKSRAAQRRHLLAEAARVPDTAAEVLTPEAEPDAATRRGGQLCGACLGRCCRLGAHTHAFIRAPQLRRWLEAHPGRAVSDAVDAYMALLPERHVDGSCVHHGERGCTLPRAMRAEVCNRYACDALRAVETLNEAGPRPVVAGVQHHHTFRAAVVLDDEGAHRLRAVRGRRASMP